jgi:hypothetical protein
MNRQLPLFGFGKVEFLKPKDVRTKSHFKKYWKKFGVKRATLRLLSSRIRKETTFHRITRQYNNIPLFYGLPTMEQWLKWEKQRGKTHRME